MMTLPKKLSRDLATEAAPRALDPYEMLFMGLIRPNDPLLIARGETVDAYLDLLRDDKVFSCLQKRIGSLIAYPWTVDQVSASAPADTASPLTEILKCFNFDQFCRDLMQALLTGFAVVEIVWGAVDGKIVPVACPARKLTRFVYRDVPDAAPELRLLTRNAMLDGIALPEKKFVVHRVNPRDDNPYGLGLGWQLYWPVYFKRGGLIAWAKFVDRFGTPTPWGQYRDDVEDVTKARETMMEALKRFSSDGCIATPAGSVIQLLEAHAGGNITTQEQLYNACNDAISAIILGTEPRANSGGAQAAAAAERIAVRLDLVQADADLLSDTINRSLIAWLCEFNGLPPCNVSRQVKEEKDKKLEAETDEILARIGFHLTDDAFAAKYGDGYVRQERTEETGGREPETTRMSVGFADQAEDARVASDADMPGGDNPVMAAWLSELSAQVSEWFDETPAMTGAELAAKLFAAYADLPMDDMVQLLTEALAAAELRGRNDAREN